MRATSRVGAAHAELPGIRGTWHPGETHGRLDMQVLVRDSVLIEECFGGFGVGDIGSADGLESFTINSFHVLMSALWAHHDPEEVESEAWNVGPNDKFYSARRFIVLRESVDEAQTPV